MWSEYLHYGKRDLYALNEHPELREKRNLLRDELQVKYQITDMIAGVISPYSVTYSGTNDEWNNYYYGTGFFRRGEYWALNTIEDLDGYCFVPWELGEHTEILEAEKKLIGHKFAGLMLFNDKKCNLKGLVYSTYKTPTNPFFSFTKTQVYNFFKDMMQFYYLCLPFSLSLIMYGHPNDFLDILDLMNAENINWNHVITKRKPQQITEYF